MARARRCRHGPISAGFVGSALVIAVASFLLIIVVGFAFYEPADRRGQDPGAGDRFVVGTLTFSALGVAVAGLIRSQEAAPAVTNAIILPMAFISNTFIAVDESAMPRWLDIVAGLLPLRPFVESMQAPFNPTVEAPGILAANLAIARAWGVVGVVIAARSFKWEPIADTARRLAGGDAARGTRRSGRRDSCTAVSPTDPPLPPSPDEPSEEPRWGEGEGAEPSDAGVAGGHDELADAADGEVDLATDEAVHRRPWRRRPTSRRT